MMDTLIKDILDIFDDIYDDSDISIDELIAVQHLIQNLDPEGDRQRTEYKNL